jgi:DNA-binding HxlR family transcriptional regulator
VNDRSYGQYCGIARALDLVGERWAMLVVRELILGPKRFVDLKTGLPGIGTNVLATRLRQLERGGVVQRRTLPPPAGSAVYDLTEYGRRLEPALLALGRWGAESLGARAPGQALRSGWVAVALRAFFRPEAANGLRKTVDLRLADGIFQVRIEDGCVEIAEGPSADPDLTVTTDDEALIGFLAGAGVPASALDAEGDTVLLGRLPELFRFGSGPV